MPGTFDRFLGFSVESRAAMQQLATAQKEGAYRSESSDRPLIELGERLKDAGYAFTTTTPTTHLRVTARGVTGPSTLRDVFGWNRPFRDGDIPSALIQRLAESGVLENSNGILRSRVRFSTLSSQIFVHSAFPTVESDSVFFGPDTYRFTRFVQSKLENFDRAERINDVGAGTGVGGLALGALLQHTSPHIILSDINTRALRYCGVNAAINKVAGVEVTHSDLFNAVEGCFDIIISNPPYLIDPLFRTYRHGGGDFGAGLSIRILEEGTRRLAPGGALILYTGSAIVDGVDLLHEAVSRSSIKNDFYFTYEEIDPDVFGEELDHPPYGQADRIAVIGIVAQSNGVTR
jgi:methylase of polypeptide subunit release factors